MQRRGRKCFDENFLKSFGFVMEAGTGLCETYTKGDQPKRFLELDVSELDYTMQHENLQSCRIGSRHDRNRKYYGGLIQTISTLAVAD